MPIDLSLLPSSRRSPPPTSWPRSTSPGSRWCGTTRSTLMSYVTFVFQSYFGYSKAKAERLMMDVHVKGRAVVSHRPP